MDGRAGRRAAVRHFKRAAIVDAARRVFAERGLDGASMRGIAAAAGYTAAALYFHFDGKEALYGEIVAASLAGLSHAVRQAVAEASGAAGRLRAGPLAFYRFYRDNPVDLELSLYLVQGLRPTGLTPALNRQLNGRLIAALQVIADAILAAGAPDREEANAEAVAAVTHMCGILLLEKTGRLGTLGFPAEGMVERYLDALEGRLVTMDRTG
jgi:AcrR family transcriptional regulator